MRLTRVIAMLLAVEILFLGGSAYYQFVFPVRILHHVIITLLLATWLVIRLRRGQGLPQTPLNIPLFAAVGVWVASAALSADPRMAFENLWFSLTHLIFFWLFADFIQRRRQRLLFEVQFIAAALVVMISALEFASWYFGLGLLPGTALGWAGTTGIPLVAPRLALALNISTLLAGYVAPVTMIALAWALTARRPYRPALGLLAAGLFVVLIFTFSRGGLLSLAAALGVLIALRTWQGEDRQREHSGHRWFRRPLNTAAFGRRLTVGLLAVGAALVLLVVVMGSTSRTSGDTGRVDMWRAALVMAADHPVLGVGTTQYGRAFREYRTPELARDQMASAHNAYLNTLAETGVVGAAVSVWLGVSLLRAWWRQRQRAGGGRRTRLDAAFAALLGLGVHSLIDVFTVTPVVLLIALLAAYCVVEPLPASVEVPGARRPERVGAIIALVIILGYGLWLGLLDVAQSRYQDSLRGGDSALASAQAAIDLDPGLRLYRLHLADLEAQQAETPAASAAIYEAALSIEPSWDTGWITLAAYREAAGDLGGALAALDTARKVNPLTPVSLHWARIAEQTNGAAADEIVSAYRQYLQTPLSSTLPLSDFWQATPLRLAALEQAVEALPLDRRYQVMRVVDPQRAAGLVPSEPSTAAGWWMTGEDALQEGDAEAALTAFDRALQLDRTNGDYYVARARAKLALADRAGAEHDLDLAYLLGTTDEYPNALRADLTEDAEARQRLNAAALPPRRVSQEFVTVLYGRPANFDLPISMRPPGPGYQALLPWYEIAETAMKQGEVERARQVYRAILEYAPDEAARLLAELD